MKSPSGDSKEKVTNDPEVPGNEKEILPEQPNEDIPNDFQDLEKHFKDLMEVNKSKTDMHILGSLTDVVIALVNKSDADVITEEQKKYIIERYINLLKKY